MVSNQFLELLLNTAEKQRVNVAVGEYLSFDNEVPEAYYSNSESIPCEIISGRKACYLDYYQGGNAKYASACWKLFKRNLFATNRFPEGKICEDEAIILQILFMECRIAVIDAPVYFYRQRSDSIMHKRFSVKKYDLVERLKGCAKFYSKMNDPELAQLAENKSKLRAATNYIEAKACHATYEVPEQYRMNENKAWRTCKKYWSEDGYQDFLSKIHPRIA